MRSINCLTLLVVLAVSLAVSQSPQEKPSYLKQAEIQEAKGKIQIVANSPRPLEQVLDALQQKYGWTVNYEDPRFISKLDVAQPLTPAEQVLPAGGAFTVDFSSSLEKEKILQVVVDSYNESNNPGRFELKKNGEDGFTVVGVKARDSQGRLSRQKALLDVPITIPKQKRSMSDTLKLICQTLSKLEGTTVTLGVMPKTLLEGNQVQIGGVQFRAREALQQCLTLPGHQLYWRLLFDPKSKNYWLDIHLMRQNAAH